MSLNPQVELLLQQLQKEPPLNELSPQQARIQAQAGYHLNPNRQINVGNIYESLLPNYQTPIPLRIYTPVGAGKFPILVYLHGGGWVIGNLEAADGTCRFLCKEANCIVVSVDYRKAPEYKFPTAIEDAYAVTVWVSRNATNFNGNPQQIAVAGDSAGGNLASVVALMARDRGTPSLVHQLLIYPVTNYNFDTPSYYEYAQNYGLTQEEMLWCWQHYLSSPTEGNNPYVSPLQANNLSNLPSANIITAECDILRSEGEAYATRLQEAGVNVTSKCYQGMIHSFLGLPQLNSLANVALSEIAAELYIALRR